MRHMFAFVLAIVLIGLAGGRMVYRPGDAIAPTDYDDAQPVPVFDNILRLHVLANSDAPGDQAVKLQVRDALLPLFSDAQSYAEARAFLLENGGDMQRICEDTLRENGFSYGVQLELGVSDFPERDYGAAHYPAGEYNALRVLLGDGAGQNWWCVLFPPLCIISDEELPEDGEFAFESDIWNWLKGLISREER